MRCIISTSSNPYFNLATEDYFLKSSNGELFLLYINEPCIVVGKHQNLLSEINIPFAIENNLKAARRISGGGTVYQDFNNLNFSFIHECANLEKISFSKFTTPVLDALKEMGFDVEYSGRNDILIDGKKISGNAMHIYKNRVLSHGTLLFKTDLIFLSAALKNNPQKYFDRSIKSVRSKVTNISEYSSKHLTFNDFTTNLFNYIIHISENSSIQPLNSEEIAAITRIAIEKYETWEWIYGYSPRYTFKNSFELPTQEVTFEMQVEKGIIRSLIVDIDPDVYPDYHKAFDILLNERHDYAHISRILRNSQTNNYLPTINITAFCNMLF